MAKNPRLTTSVSPECYELITEIASITGQSNSKVLSDVLEQVLPVIKMIHVNLKKISDEKGSMDEQVKSKILTQLARAESRSKKRLESQQKEFENVFKIR